MNKNIYDKYESVIGVEVHVELKTKSKLFCSCKNSFGEEANTLCCPVCMGFPGILPTLNKGAIEKAVAAGIALNCKINYFSSFDRKNYFYPDLPKAYQITQYFNPICNNGYVNISNKKIHIIRMHIEEDAGKLIHQKNKTYCDFNRCGVPLIEIVTAPEFSNGEEIWEFGRKLKTILNYADVSDCKMQEGSLRCDVNISVRKKGSNILNTSCEIKNINSFSNIKKAINYEFIRQVDVIEEKKNLEKETRGYDEQTGKTYKLRDKESGNDYRYLPEPDIPPLIINDNFVNNIKKSLPVLPDELLKHYLKLGINEEYSRIIVSDFKLSTFANQCLLKVEDYNTLFTLIAVEILRLLKDEIKISVKNLADITNFLSDEEINYRTAKELINYFWGNPKDNVSEIIDEKKLWQINDERKLIPIIEEILNENISVITDYLKGNEKSVGRLIGIVMKRTSGCANPSLTESIILKTIKKQMIK